MPYEVFARKWRPQLFQDVIGQDHITQTLINAIKTDRLAHAYLFSGARGVGTRRSIVKKESPGHRVINASRVRKSQMAHLLTFRKLMGHPTGVLTRSET
jgi:replication-associated recombination protein RarA